MKVVAFSSSISFSMCQLGERKFFFVKVSGIWGGDYWMANWYVIP